MSLLATMMHMIIIINATNHHHHKQEEPLDTRMVTPLRTLIRLALKRRDNPHRNNSTSTRGSSLAKCSKRDPFISWRLPHLLLISRLPLLLEVIIQLLDELYLWHVFVPLLIKLFDVTLYHIPTTLQMTSFDAISILMLDMTVER